MAVTLLRLSDGRSSLEFARSDLAAVAAAIRERHGAPEATVHPTVIAYRFGGCDFVFQDDWDDPCLISRSPEGDRILETLCAALDPGP